MESVGLAWIVRVTAGWGSPGVLEAMAKLLVTVRGGRSWAGPADPRGEELAPSWYMARVPICRRTLDPA